jgi:hypothetical protein
MPSNLEIFHAASIEIAVPAQTAFDYVSDPMRHGEWTLGAWNRRDLGGGLYGGVSLFSGEEGVLRLDPDPERLIVDCYTGGTPDSLRRAISIRVVDGPSVGRADGTCIVTIMKWRSADDPDENWERVWATHETEVHMIRGRLELGF